MLAWKFNCVEKLEKFEKIWYYTLKWFEDSDRVAHDQVSLITVANAIDGFSCVKLDHGDVIVCYIYGKRTAHAASAAQNSDQRDLIHCNTNGLRARSHAPGLPRWSNFTRRCVAMRV